MDAYFWLGDFATAQKYSDEFIALYDDDADPKLMAAFGFDTVDLKRAKDLLEKLDT